MEWRKGEREPCIYLATPSQSESYKNQKMKQERENDRETLVGRKLSRIKSSLRWEWRHKPITKIRSSAGVDLSFCTRWGIGTRGYNCNLSKKLGEGAMGGGWGVKLRCKGGKRVKSDRLIRSFWVSVSTWLSPCQSGQVRNTKRWLSAPGAVIVRYFAMVGMASIPGTLNTDEAEQQSENKQLPHQKNGKQWYE